MKDLELEITYTGKGADKGWRMANKKYKPDNYKRFKNPDVKKYDTITWYAPKYNNVTVVILADSAFGFTGVIDILKEKKSAKFKIADVSKITYEYAVLVKNSKGDYTYVRGENSPPGVIVGG